jgi:hypothetical protein
MTISIEKRNTPEGRLAVIARKVVELKDSQINDGRKLEHQTDYPDAPTESDFLELMGPYVRIEVLSAVLKTLEKHSGSYKEALEVVNELKALRDIAAARPTWPVPGAK